MAQSDHSTVMPNGMSPGAMARLEKEVEIGGYEPIGFRETRFGAIFIAEKMGPDDEGVVGWNMKWGARDFRQNIWCPLASNQNSRIQVCVDNALLSLADYNKLTREV